MDIIQDYPTLYNRSSRDFKDKTKKANCWAAVAEKVNEPVDIATGAFDSLRRPFCVCFDYFRVKIRFKMRAFYIPKGREDEMG